MPTQNDDGTNVNQQDLTSESTMEKIVDKVEDASKATFNALKNAIGAVGDAMADLAETSSPIKREIGAEAGPLNDFGPEEPANLNLNTQRTTDNEISTENSALPVADTPQENSTVAEEVESVSKVEEAMPSGRTIPPNDEHETNVDKSVTNVQSSNKADLNPVEEGTDLPVSSEDLTEQPKPSVGENSIKDDDEGKAIPRTDEHTTNADESDNKIVANAQNSNECESNPDNLSAIILNETATSNQSAPLFIEVAEGEKKTTVIETSETVTRSEGEQPIIVETKTTVTTFIATEDGSSAVDSTNALKFGNKANVAKDAENNSSIDSEEEIILAEDELDNITLGDNEYIVGEVIDVDDTVSVDTMDSKGEPKKKKKLRLFKKIKRGTKAIVIDAPKAVAYGALFSAGALVGGSIVGSKAIGHGAVTGTKEVGHGIVSGTKAIGHGAQAIGHGAQELAKNAANAIADGSRAGAEFVTDTGDKIVVGTKEFAQNVADGTVKVAKGTKIIIVDSAEAVAYGALYGTGAIIGGTKAIGHGVVDGTVKVAEGTLNTAGTFVKASASAVGDVVDGAKGGANAVANTANKAVNAVEDKAREALMAAVEATAAGAQFAGYGKDGRPLAIKSAPNKKKDSK